MIQGRSKHNFGREFCTGNLVSVYKCFSIHVKMCVLDVVSLMWANTVILRDRKRPSAMESVQICRFETFWVTTLTPRTFRCFNVHVKTCVLLRSFAKI